MVIDAVIVVAVLLFGFLGWRDGLVRALLAYAGFLGGAAAGIALAPRLLERLHLSVWTALAALGIVIAGAWLGRWLMIRLDHTIRLWWGWQPLDWIDRPGGALAGAVAAVGVSWMVALAVASSAVPDLSASVSRSGIIQSMKQVPPPFSEWVANEFSELGRDLDYPRYVDVLTSERIVDAKAAPESAAQAEAVLAATRSVVRIEARQSTNAANEGTAFVVAPGRLMTAAHVVGKASEVLVDSSGGRVVGSLVYCDPLHDVAVLRTTVLDGAPLRFTDAVPGQVAATIGFPADGPLTVRPARIRAVQEWQSADIWGEGRYAHGGYQIRSLVQGGNSGGPLVDLHGHALGVVAAASRADRRTGYVLTRDQVFEALSYATSGVETTASCVPD